jgi:hypothetical protein
VGLGGIVACLAGGALSDQIGRKPAMVIFTMLTLFSVVPAFRAIVHYRTALALLGWVAVLSILGEFWTSPLLVWLVESLRLQSRFAWRNGDRGRSCPSLTGMLSLPSALQAQREGIPLCSVWTP